jgi:putative ABC transport system permease protein
VRVDVVGAFPAGRSLFGADVAEDTRVRGGCRAYDGRRNRCRDRHIHSRQRRPFTALPFRDPDRLVTLWTTVSLGMPKTFVGVANYVDWREQNRVFEDIGLTRPIANFNLTGSGTPERLEGARISENVLPVLGVEPLLGRNITEEERRTDAAVVLLSYGLWQRRFAGDQSILGRKILLNGTPFEVIGVMRPGFQYPGRHEIWAPMYFAPDELQNRMSFNYVAVARLKPGVNIRQARADMERIAANLARQYPDANGKQGVIVESLHDSVTAAARGPLLALFASVAALLALACANVAGLLLARATARQREFSVRAALGATRARIAGQLLAEIVPLSVAGGILGLALARLLLNALIPYLPREMPRTGDFGLDFTVLAFGMSLSLASAALAVLLPAIHAGRVELAHSLKEDSRTSAGRRSSLRNALVVAQVGITFALLVCSGLLLQSFNRLTHVDPGFVPDGVLTMHLAISRSRYPADGKVAAYCRRLVDSVSTVPGVQAAGMVNRLPLSGIAQTLTVQSEASDAPVNIDSRIVTPAYFQAIGIPLLKGRNFTEADADPERPVGIVDEQIARRLWPNEEPIGKRFRIFAKGVFAGPWTEVVGVVRHIRNDGLDSDTRPQIYWNYLQRTQDRMVMVVRTAGDPASLASAIVQRIQSVDAEQPVYDVRSMEQWRDLSLRQRSLTTAIIVTFAGTALILASLAIYGLLAYLVVTRLREFAIRMALGATREKIHRLVLGYAFRLTAMGLLLGIALSVPLVRVVRSLLFGVGLADRSVLAAAVVAVIASALTAGLIPALRAMRSDPAAALRNE